jgi:hypothetical protein
MFYLVTILVFYHAEVDNDPMQQQYLAVDTREVSFSLED